MKWMTIIMTVLSMTLAEASVFNSKTFTLKNGLQVVVVENHLAPAVSVAVLYKVGTADDPLNMVGLSHFLEHIMFKGTKDVPAGEFKRRIVSKGGSINAATSFDFTIYTTDIAVEHLEDVLSMEADRMQNLAFNQNEINSELNVVMEERLMRVENNPLGAAHEALLRTLYWHHPYGVPPIGYQHHILAYTRDALQEHYKKWYLPNNAVLIVSGDITLEALKIMAEKHFGAIPQGIVPKRVRPMEPPHEGFVAKFEFESPRVSAVTVSWIYRAPSHKTAKDTYYYALDVLEQILAGNNNSRFYQAFVRNKKTNKSLALAVNADYEGTFLDDRTFTLSVTLHPTVTVAVMEDAMQNEMHRMLETGITDEELLKAKRDLKAKLAFIRDGNDHALKVFEHLAVGFTIEEIEAWATYIDKVTKAQVLEAARHVFRAKPLATLVVYPKASGKASAPVPLEKVVSNDATVH